MKKVKSKGKKGDKKNDKPPTQLVGNVGLYYVCYKLSQLGWNVLQTSRNAKGVDIIIYNQDATKTRTIQVKSLRRRDSVPIGRNPDSMFADIVVLCTKVLSENPTTYVLRKKEFHSLVKYSMIAGEKMWWLQPVDYETFQDKWNKIGMGFVG